MIRSNIHIDRYICNSSREIYYHQSGNFITGAVFPIWEISRGNLPGQGMSYPGAFLMTIGMVVMVGGIYEHIQ